MTRARSLEGVTAGFSEAFTRSWICFIAIQSGDLTRAAEVTDDMVAFCGRKGLAMWGGYALMYQTICAAHRDPSPEVEATILAVIDTMAAMHVTIMSEHFVAEHARVIHALGDPGRAVDRYSEALALADEYTEMHEVADILRLRGRARLDSGEKPGAAAADFRAAADLADRQGSVIYGIRALCDTLELVASVIDEDHVATSLAELVDEVVTPDDYAEVARARALLSSR